MAKKSKKTRTASKKHNLSDDHSFLILVGGGFIVIVFLLMLMSRTSVKDRFASVTNSSETKVVADKNTVTISSDMLTPETLTVPVGTQVTWVNADEDEHMISSYNGSFDSKELDTGEKSTYMFTTAGTYTYTVGEMTGTVVVE